MRILFINDHVRAGGKEKYLRAVRAALHERGHVTCLVYSVVEDRDRLDREIAFAVPGLDLWRGSRETIRRLRDCTNLFKPDVVHLNYNVRNLIALTWLLRQFPVIRSVHDVAFVCPTVHFVRANTGKPCDAKCGAICFSSGCLSAIRPRSWYRLFRTRLVQWMQVKWSELNTHSEYLRTQLQRVSGGPPEASMLPVFAQDGEETESRNVPRTSFLFAGRLNYWKGPHIAIEAISRIPERYTLEIAGAGSFENELRNRVRELNLELRVTFLGDIGENQIRRRCSKTLAVVVPSIMPENCPLSVQEAMVGGTPVIASKAGGIPDLIEDGVTGILAEPNDAAALAEAMKRLIVDADLARKLALNAGRFIRQEKFQRDYHISKLIETYQRCGKRGHKARG